MKEYLQTGSKQFVKLIIINIMCIFVVFSLSVLTTAAFTQKIGYDAYGVMKTNAQDESLSDSDGKKEVKSEKLYTYYYSEGKDAKKAEYEKQGYRISFNYIRSEVPKRGNITFLIITQIICLVIQLIFISPALWHQGTRDSNAVKFMHKKADRLKGLKIGFISVIPNYVFLASICILKLLSVKKFPMTLYKFLNATYYSFIDLLIGKNYFLSDFGWNKMTVLFVLPLITVLISFFAYFLGYKNITVVDSLVYKNDKG